jgi:DNA-binding PadR family transcriptional regulator
MAVRMTIPSQLVLQVLLENPERELYGLEIGSAAGLASGTVHPLLARLERHGWLESRWEDIDPSTAGRPARRYYRLTPHGAEQARAALARARAGRPQGVPLSALGQGA